MRRIRRGRESDVAKKTLIINKQISKHSRNLGRKDNLEEKIETNVTNDDGSKIFNNKGRNLKSDEEVIFENYCLGYDGDKPEEAKRKIELQRHVFETLKLEMVSIEDTALPRLLDMTIHEIDTQYVRKEHFENRFGFLIAFWGILFGVVLQSDIIDRFRMLVAKDGLLKYTSIVSLIVCIITGFLSLLFIMKGLITRKYYRFNFEDRDINYRCAIDDVDMAYIYMLEVCSNSRDKNEILNDKKARYVNLSIVFIGLFCVDVIGIVFLSIFVGL